MKFDHELKNYLDDRARVNKNIKGSSTSALGRSMVTVTVLEALAGGTRRIMQEAALGAGNAV